MKFKVQFQVRSEGSKFMRKRWHSVDAGSPRGAVEAVLRRHSKAVPRLASMSGGRTLDVSVAPDRLVRSPNVGPKGVPFLVYGFDVTLGGK